MSYVGNIIRILAFLDLGVLEVLRSAHLWRGDMPMELLPTIPCVILYGSHGARNLGGALKNYQGFLRELLVFNSQ